MTFIARKKILEASKDWIAYTKNTASARDASAAMDEGCTRLVDLFNTLAGPSVKEILELQRSLRGAPAVRSKMHPAVVLVGAPNVGKSSIVGALYISNA
jgi:GTP1/Obg family GTP-binding protein